MQKQKIQKLIKNGIIGTILSVLVFFSISFFGCNPKTESPTDKEIGKLPKQTFGKKFFDYDQVDYYYNPIGDYKSGELIDNKSKSVIDSFAYGVVLQHIPKDISDTSFVQKLEKIGYTKSTLDTTKHKGIDYVFVEKTVSEHISTPSIYVYRDILVFKKKNQIIGTAKIHFEGLDAQINGTNANIGNFGQDLDYLRLEIILRKEHKATYDKIFR